MLTVFKNTLAFDPSKIAAICLTPYDNNNVVPSVKRCEVAVILYGATQALTMDMPADEAKPFANKLLAGDLSEFATKFTDEPADKQDYDGPAIPAPKTPRDD